MKEIFKENLARTTIATLPILAIAIIDKHAHADPIYTEPPCKTLLDCTVPLSSFRSSFLFSPSYNKNEVETLAFLKGKAKLGKPYFKEDLKPAENTAGPKFSVSERKKKIASLTKRIQNDESKAVTADRTRELAKLYKLRAHQNVWM